MQWKSGKYSTENKGSDFYMTTLIINIILVERYTWCLYQHNLKEETDITKKHGAGVRGILLPKRRTIGKSHNF